MQCNASIIYHSINLQNTEWKKALATQVDSDSDIGSLRLMRKGKGVMHTRISHVDQKKMNRNDLVRSVEYLE